MNYSRLYILFTLLVPCIAYSQSCPVGLNDIVVNQGDLFDQSWVGGSGSQIHGVRRMADRSGMVTQIGIVCGNGAANIKAALYSDNGHSPDILLSGAPIFDPSGAFNELDTFYIELNTPIVVTYGEFLWPCVNFGATLNYNVLDNGMINEDGFSRIKFGNPYVNAWPQDLCGPFIHEGNYAIFLVIEDCVEPDLIFGCTSQLACNFNVAANTDDGSCDFPSELDTMVYCLGGNFNFPCEIDDVPLSPGPLSNNYTTGFPIGETDIRSIKLFPFIDYEDNNQLNIYINTILVHSVNLDEALWECHIYPIEIQLSDEVIESLESPPYLLFIEILGFVVCDGVKVIVEHGPLPILGCTDPSACNFFANATCSSGDCEYASCVQCEGDFNDDLARNTTDLLMFLSNVGCVNSEECFADLSGDNNVNTSDLLIFLSFYGQLCE